MVVSSFLCVLIFSLMSQWPGFDYVYPPDSLTTHVSLMTGICYSNHTKHVLIWIV